MNRNANIRSIEQSDKLFDRETARADQTAQSSFGNLLVVRHGKRSDVPRLDQDHVAALLPGEFPSGSRKRLHHLASADVRQRGHQATTSSSSVSTVSGIPRSARTSRQAAMASRAFSRASVRVLPWLTQPGIAGHSTIHIPSSSRVIEVTNFISRNIPDTRYPRKPDSGSGSRPLSPDWCQLTTANGLHLLAFWSFSLLVPLHALTKEAA